MEIILEQDEAELLSGMLRSALADLREEIHHTQISAYKADLKLDEVLLRGILAKLSAQIPVQRG